MDNNTSYTIQEIKTIKNDSDTNSFNIKKTDTCIKNVTIKQLQNDNPHARQNKCIKYAHKFSRTLNDDMPRLKYYKRKGGFKSVLHWGQRKLLLVEIEFLNMFSTDGDIVLYAGAAPGNHIPYLSKLFPTLEFALFDPNDFSIKEGGKIKIYQKYFTDEIAQIFAGRDDVLFISDIRTASPSTMLSDEIELRVEEDNKAQKRWYEIVNAKKTMLKFRLPWLVPFELDKYGKYVTSPHNSRDRNKKYKWVTTGNEKFVYLKGDIYIQPWAPQTSTETRLVIGPVPETGVELTTYDNTAYEEQMFYYNNNVRPTLFEHCVKGEGLDHCYDCATEVHILTNYFTRINGSGDYSDDVSKMSKAISRLLGGRRLDQPQPSVGHRKFRPTKLIEQGYDPSKS